MSDYTPSVAEIVMGKTHLGDNFWRELSEAEVRRGIEAVRAEARERALREAADAVLHNVSDPAYVGDPGEYARGYRQGIRDATRALRRAAQKGDERCPQCGCEIAYPNAVHILDCGSGARAQGKDQDRCDR